jgi:hypothetical protein
MIETIDRHGLKGRYLRKYLRSVERFYRLLAGRDYQSELAVKYQKRFEKNRTSLFTALHRNFAERAIDGVFSDRGFSIDSAV